MPVMISINQDTVLTICKQMPFFIQDGIVNYILYILTYLCRVELPSLIDSASSLFDDSFHFYLNFYGTFCKQTVESLTRRRLVLLCLPMPTKRTLCLNG